MSKDYEMRLEDENGNPISDKFICKAEDAFKTNLYRPVLQAEGMIAGEHEGGFLISLYNDDIELAALLPEDQARSLYERIKNHFGYDTN